MSTVKEIAQSNSPRRVEGGPDDRVVRNIWFKTKPLDRTFCNSVAQIQLITNSRDQGFVDDNSAGSWSWFELLILPNAEATQPRVKDGVELVWRSHFNNLAMKERSNHFGLVFDRRQDLLNELDIGNVIAVRVCVRFPGWVNDANDGRIVAKVLDEELFAPNPWSLSTSEQQLGVYTVTSSRECYVSSEDHNLVSQIWFTTPHLDETVVSGIEQIQLITNSHNQGFASNPESGSWTWFDIVVLESPEETTPKVKNGRALVFHSHNTDIGQDENALREGPNFDRHHELLGLLEVGDVIAVRVCARFQGWRHYAHDARLVVRTSTKGPVSPKAPINQDWEEIMKENERLKASIAEYLNQVTPVEAPPAYSIEADLLTSPLRADNRYGSGGRPLRLLSLDGGGVRGISSLHILHSLEGTMLKLTGSSNTKPCEYFDMVGGTSTGGLIAIMLGRLRMSISDCIQAYEDMAKRIFDRGWFEGVKKTGTWLASGAQFDHAVLEAAIKDIVGRHLNDENATMLDPEESSCKAFVLAVRANNTTNMTATYFRTYVNPRVEDSFAQYPIWQAGRATSAAPLYFARMKVGDWEYVDGGLGFNNPVIMLMIESRLYYGYARAIGCLVSIGTGIAPNSDLGSEGPTDLVRLGKAAIAIATNSEHAHHQAEKLSEDGTYFRFNAGERIAEVRYTKESGWIWKKKEEIHLPENWADKIIGLEDWSKMPAFVKFTQEYLAKEQQRLDRCAEKLATGKTG